MKDNVIVFGRGAYWQCKKKSVIERFNVVGYLDNNAIEGELEEGTPVYKPQNMSVLSKDKIIIMASRQYFVEMAKQLVLLGISLQRIVLGINLLPCFDQGEELIQERHGQVTFDGRQAILQCDAGVFYFDTADGYANLIRQLSMKDNNWQDFFSSIQKPISRHFGMERGHAIDRYYIEKFLEENLEEYGNIYGLGKNKYIDKCSFSDYVKDFLIQIKNKENNVNILEKIENLLKNIDDISTKFYEEYKFLIGKHYALNLIRIKFAKIVEYIVALDRVVFLIEKGINNVKLIRIFNNHISPRNILIYASKD